MSEGKSEAQLKNEEEVKRILRERGYSPSSSKKQAAKAFGSLSIKPFIVAIFLIGTGVCGWYFFQNNPFEKKQDDIREDGYITMYDSEDYAGFNTCLDSIDKSTIPIEDNDFWNKLISRYEQTISCYEKYPSVANLSEKNEYQSKLDEVKSKAQQKNSSDEEYRKAEAESERKYQEELAKIKAEGEKRKAQIDAETDKRFEEYDKQKAERDAQYKQEQEEREAKQAKCDNFKAQYPDVDTYKTKNGNLDELWNAYQDAKDKYNSALRAYGQSNPNHSDEWREAVWNGVKEKESIMNAAYNAWNSSNTALSNGYNNGFREACL